MIKKVKVYELAKKLGVKSKVLVAEIDEVDHHLDTVPDHIVEKYLGIQEAPETPVEAVVEQEPSVDMENKEEAVVEAIPAIVEPSMKKDECPVDMATLKLSLRGAGAKSPYWKYRHLVG